MMSNFWIHTANARPFYYDTPEKSDINIEDIAYHLSHINRFAGATSIPWNDARHSVFVSDIILNELNGSPEDALMGLLHDAHEYIIGDIPTPFSKFIASKVGYDVIEQIKREYDHVIYEQLVGFRPSKTSADLIKIADYWAFITEAHHLLKDTAAWLPKIYPPLDVTFVEVSPADSRQLFLDTYTQLKAEAGL